MGKGEWQMVVIRRGMNQFASFLPQSTGGRLGSCNLVSIQRFPGYHLIRRNSYLPENLLPLKTATNCLVDNISISISPISQALTLPDPKASSSKFRQLIESAVKLSLSIANRFSPKRRGGSRRRDQERIFPFRIILMSKCTRPVLC
jgi:hypothetical protein